MESVEVLAGPGQNLVFDNTLLYRLGRPITIAPGKYEKAEAVLRVRSGVFVDATLCGDKYKLEVLEMISAIPTIEAVHIAIGTSWDLGNKEVAALTKVSALKSLSLGGTDDHLAAIDWRGLSELNCLEVLLLSVSTPPDLITKALIAHGQSLHVPRITIALGGEMPAATARSAIEGFQSKLHAALPGRYSIEISEPKGTFSPSISIIYGGGGTRK